MTQNAWNAEYNNAKGAILVGNATEPVVLTVGSDGQVLTADSVAATGVSWSTPGETVVWGTISASQTLATNHGYICITPGGALALALPATSSVGDIIEVVLRGATSWQITQAASQQIFLGTASTTAGVGGSVASTAQGDSLRIVCSLANDEWVAISGWAGNLVVA